MAIIVTPARRRIAMGVMLAFAAAGGVIRHEAPDPSTLRDIGTLLLVLWLPAVGNLVAYFVRLFAQRKRPPPPAASGAPFTAHVLTRIDPAVLPAQWLATLDPDERHCTAVVGRRGVTVQTQAPLAQWLAEAPRTLALHCLVPSVALRELRPGTAFALLLGSTVLAQGVVEQVPRAQR